MDKRTATDGTMVRKSLVGLRGISLLLFPVLVALLLLSGTTAVMVCLFWLFGLFSLVLVLSGMNSNIVQG